MSRNRAKAKDDVTTQDDTEPQARTRSMRFENPKNKNANLFTELYANVYPADPSSTSISTQQLKLKLYHKSSLPGLKKFRPHEEPRTVPDRECRRKKDCQQLVSYTDDEDNDANDDHDVDSFNFSSAKPSTNKFAIKKISMNVKLLDTNSPTKGTKEKSITPVSFYNKTKSPKTYRRIVPDTSKSNGPRLNPLAIIKVPSRVPSESTLIPSRNIFPAFDCSNSEPCPRRGIHRETRTVKKRRNIVKMETIDLIDCEEFNMSTFMELDSSSNNSEAVPSAPPADCEPDPQFQLCYDDETDPPPISFGNYTEQLKMEIKFIYFGSLKCMPLDLLEVDSESFKLHIQLQTFENTLEQLLNIQTGNIEFVELHKRNYHGYLHIKPKEDTCNRLSHNLNLTPGLYLNYSDNQVRESYITIVFDNRSYSLFETYNTLKGMFDFPIALIENDNIRMEMYENSAPESGRENPRKVECKSNSKNSSTSLTLSSSDSPEYLEEVPAGRNKEHSYCELKRDNRKPPEVIQEFNQLVESDTDKLLTYPAVGHSRRITIDKGTVSCLQPEMFLNDTIIEFYLLYIYHQILSPSQRDQVHIFNTFFYTKLTNNLNSKLDSKNMHEKHSLVSKWTKNVDLFEKDFILIPIHDHAHWLLAIICYPSLAGRDLVLLQDDDAIDLELMGMTRSLRRKKSVEKLACILIFDSLAIKRNDVIINLRFYLQAEWDARYKSRGPYNCTNSTLVGHHPKLPIQPNSSDCGLFVMQYAESFFTDSLHDFSFPLKLNNWFSLDEIKHKRNVVIKLIFDLSKNENYKQM